MRPTTLAALALLAPLSAEAADPSSVTFNGSTVSVSVTSGPSDYGLKDCKDNTSTIFTATYSKPVPSGTTLAIWLSGGANCDSTPSGNSISDSNNTATKTITARDITDTDGSNCPVGKTIEKRICVVAKSPTTSSTAAYIPVIYHSAPPDTPKLKSAVGGDEVVHLQWSTSGTINLVRVFYLQLTKAPDSGVDLCPPPAVLDAGSTGDASGDTGADTTDAGETSNGDTAGGDASAGDGGSTDAGYDESQFTTVDFTSTSGDMVSGLKNGATYLFFVKAVDQYDNESGRSEAKEVTPELVQDFYRRYRCQGGQETGGFGCTSAGAAALVPAFGALAFAALRRRGGRRP